MKLYLLTQQQTTGYDTFSAMVVAAETPEMARKIHPPNVFDYIWDDEREMWSSMRWKRLSEYNEYGYHTALLSNDDQLKSFEHSHTWANDLTQIQVKYLGDAAPEIKHGEILSSFHAG